MDLNAFRVHFVLKVGIECSWPGELPFTPPLASLALRQDIDELVSELRYTAADMRP